MNGEPREPDLWWPALLRLAFAGITFIVVYGGCNQLTALREPVPTLMLPWESQIPFVKEFIIPYWSLDLFFCGAFFVCPTRAQLNLLTRRLVVVVLASGFCFLLFPLKLGFDRPEPEGWTAFLFKALYFNDLPYNLAPSLHISLRSLIWVFYGARLSGWTRRVVKVWFMLIGVSTLLVWQHHLLDVASGFVMGWAVGVLVPDPHQPGTRNPSPTLVTRYAMLALICAALCFVSIYLIWPAVACAIVALAYGTGNSRILGKENGTLSPAAEWCLLPVLVATRLVQSRWLTRKPGWHEIGEGVLFGRKLTEAEASFLAHEGDLAVLDLTAESNAPPSFRERASYHNLPLLDLVPLKPEHIQTAIAIIQQERAAGRRVYVHCQLGLQRSAVIAAHWLVAAGEEKTLDAAINRVQTTEPMVVINNHTKPA